MGHRYLGKNINLFLLIVIIISILGFTGVTTYFNQKYEVISNEYRNISKELKGKNLELITAKNELLQLKGTLNQTSTDVGKWDELYTDKVNELETTEVDLASEKAETQRLKNDVQSITNSFNEEKERSERLNTLHKGCELELGDCTHDLAYYSEYKDDFEACEDVCPDWETS